MSESATDAPGSGSKGLVLAIIIALVVGVVMAPVGLVLLLAMEDEDSASASTCLGPNGGQALTVSTSGAMPLVQGYSPEQVTLAATIMTVAEQNGLGANAQIVGIITAIQESTLGAHPSISLPNGDGDAGPFQQRQLDGWYGSLAEVTNPVYAATAFFTGVTADSPGDYGSAGGGAGHGHLPGLIDIDGWESMTPGEAAQAVQRSAYPDAYQGHVEDAQRLMSALSGVDVNIDAAACTEVAASGDASAAIERGRSLLGTPYDFGGGDENGPSPYGIDCSGFVMYALAAAGVTGLPRTSQQQYDYLAGNEVSVADVQPGDLIFESWGRTGPGGISHVTMYIGDGQVIEASRGAMKVKISPTRFENPAFVGIRRVLTNDTTTEGN